MSETMVPSSAVRSAERAVEARYSVYLEEAQRLIQAGFDEISDKGSVDPRVSDIVRRAGLSNKAFYRHFKSKEELLLAVLEEGMQRRRDDFDTHMAAASSPLERVRIWILRVAELAVDPESASGTRPLLVYQATLAENLGPQVRSNVDRLRSPLEQALSEAKVAGELPDIDLARASDHVYHATWGWVHGRILAYEQPTRDEAEALADFILRGLR
ncbi:MAG: TetR/AcrR family transcriptional regulator [Deltaproteobacteria bacterium]|nr:TetR/AcrR family transcriptional regulator [Deltaproteobacteria bacterium]MBW2360028.1 TetR/AcrR family transcriptional regulator [Deltaproteobacteria bacterium]